MPRKIAMTLHNNSTPRISYAGITTPSSAGFITTPMPSALNAKMIDRVYSAKPGCSACGKK
jgi:hypothetical protein